MVYYKPPTLLKYLKLKKNGTSNISWTGILIEVCFLLFLSSAAALNQQAASSVKYARVLLPHCVCEGGFYITVACSGATINLSNFTGPLTHAEVGKVIDGACIVASIIWREIEPGFGLDPSPKSSMHAH